MRKTLWRRALLTAALGLAIAGNASGQFAVQEAGFNVDRLLSLPHGLEKLAPEDAQRLRWVLANPQPSVAALERELAHHSGRAPGDDEQATLRFNRGVLLLGEIGNDDARRLLRKVYRDARAQSSAPPTAASAVQSPGRRDQLATTARLALHTLGRLGDRAMIGDCLERIGQDDPATQAATLRYLENVAPGDKMVLGRLEAMARDPSSTLYQAPMLLRTITRFQGVRHQGQSAAPSAEPAGARSIPDPADR